MIGDLGRSVSQARRNLGAGGGGGDLGGWKGPGRAGAGKERSSTSGAFGIAGAWQMLHR